MELKLISYNCKGFNISKVPSIQKLLDEYNSVFIQESWLYSSQFWLFSQYVPEWKSHSICGINEYEIQSGCPYSGVTILYRKFKQITEPVWLQSKRVCAIKIVLEHGEYYLFKVMAK